MTVREMTRICRTGIPGYDPWHDAGDCTFDAKAALRAVGFFPACLQHIKGPLAGEPIDLEDWETAIVGNIFGWYRPDGTRRYREVFVLVPRKNGKTTLGAGIALLVLFLDDEPGAEIYSVAAERDQAALCFDLAKAMVMRQPLMAGKVKALQHTMVYEARNSFYRAISAEAGSKHGYNTHCCIFDELHAQPNRSLCDVLTTSMGARKQPIMLYITTSDYARESICNEKAKYARAVRDRTLASPDPAFLPVIYEASVEDNWTDPAVWAAANPNMGVSFPRDYLERECKRAQEIPAYENTFKRLHLNICTEQADRWLSVETWDRCAGGTPYGSEYEAALEGQTCFAALDLSSIRDLSALCLWFPEGGNVMCRFWIPETGAEDKERQDKVPYTTWARQEFLNMTPGARIDYEFIRAELNALKQRYDIREVAIDPWNAAAITEQLLHDGFDVVEFRQGFASMNAPAKELERRMLGEEIVHGAHPVLRWNAMNVAARTDPAGNIKPDKAKSTERIDGIVALCMAMGRAMATNPLGHMSLYETEDLVFV